MLAHIKVPITTIDMSRVYTHVQTIHTYTHTYAHTYTYTQSPTQAHLDTHIHSFLSLIIVTVYMELANVIFLSAEFYLY